MSVSSPEAPRGRYRVLARSADLRILGEIDDYLTLDVGPAYNDVGTWDLTISDASPNADLLDPVANPGGGVIVYRDGQYVLSGPVLSIGDDYDASSEVYDVLTFTGACDNVILAGRLIYPDPASTVETMTAIYYRTASFSAEGVMLDLVNKQLGPGALTARQDTRLVLPASLGRGKTQKSPKLRFDNLLTALQKMSVNSQVGADETTQLAFRVVQVGTTLVFQVSNGAARAPYVKFSKQLGTLAGYSYTASAATTTVAILGAGLTEVPDDTTGIRVAKGLFGYEQSDTLFGRRMETFVDVGVVDPSDADTPVALADLQEQLDQQAADAFDSGQGQIGATLTPRETTQQSFGADYNVGDFATVQLPRLTFVERIREVGLSVDAQSGETITISVGTTDGGYSSRTPGVYKRLSKIQDYINWLKRNK